MALLAETAEHDARGKTAAIYTELKRLGGVPMVALIFRHLATIPGGLEWAWEAIGPAWSEGRLQEAAWRIAGDVPLEPITAISRDTLAALDVDGFALDEIRVVLDAYNRANPENMLSVLCLVRLLDGGLAPNERTLRPWTPPSPPGPLVAMADVTKLSPEVTRVLDLVAAPGEPGGPRVVQSLYRHFCHRPRFLALAATLLRQRFDDGTVGHGVARLGAAMSAAADEIVRGLWAPPAPNPAIGTACVRFGGSVIPQMIMVGRLLDQALPPR